MNFRVLKSTCGVLGTLLLVLGVILGTLGIPIFDWVVVLLGSFLLTYSIFTGGQPYLFDKQDIRG